MHASPEKLFNIQKLWKKKIEVWDLCEYKINSDKKKKETLSHSLFKIFPFNSDVKENLKLLIETERKIMAMTI